MDATQLYHKIANDMADRIKRLEDHILGGSPSDLVEYKSLTRARQELLLAMDDITQVYSRAINEDEHDG